MNNLSAYCIAILLSLTFVSNTSNADIRNTKIITTAIPPYTYKELNRTKGLIALIVKAMAQKVGHSGDIEFYPWKRALKMAQDQSPLQPILIIPLNRSEEREKKFKWIAELYRDSTVLVSLKENAISLKTPEDAAKLRVGVLGGTPLEAQLAKMGFAKIDPAENEETNARKLKFKRIDVWHVASQVARFVYLRQGFKSTDLVYGPSLDVNDLYLAGGINYPEAEAQKWREALKEIKANGTYKLILQKYSDK